MNSSTLSGITWRPLSARTRHSLLCCVVCLKPVRLPEAGSRLEIASRLPLRPMCEGEDLIGTPSPNHDGLRNARLPRARR